MPAVTTLKEEVLAVLPEASPEETQRLLAELGPDDVEMTREPFPALVMMDVRDCFGTQFHLGEVLVTTSLVQRDGRPGHGAILGDEPAKALLLACLDLLDDDQQQLARTRIAPHLARLARRAEASRGLNALMAGSTRVEFESMAAE
jgi:alpha-D-ribose 1-methylphosphonate 5-triphosphate synthase subunit PhnG